MNTLKKVFNEYFIFSKRDRNGIIFLVILLLIMIGIPWIMPSLHQNPNQQVATKQQTTPVSIETIQKENTHYYDNANKVTTRGKSYKSSSKSSNQVVILPTQPFNPNQLDYEQSLELGLSKKVAKTVQNYLNKGGKFKKPTDFKKVYGLKKADYERLLPYIQIPDTPKKKSYPSKPKKSTYPNKKDSTAPTKKSYTTNPTPSEHKKRNTNTAPIISTPPIQDNPRPIVLENFNPNKLSYEQALTLGLSKKVAKTIQNYLNKGGKFNKPADFKKIYGLKEGDFNRLVAYIQIPQAPAKWEKTAQNTSKSFERIKTAPTLPKPTVAIQHKATQTVPKPISKFNPNDLTYDKTLELGLSKKVAKTLQNYLNKGGNFRKANDFKKIYGLKQKDFERLLPYIQIPNATTPATSQVKKASADESIKVGQTKKESSSFTDGTISSEEKNNANAAIKPKKPDTTKTNHSATDWTVIPSPAKAKRNSIQIKLNQATPEEWEQLRGIGPRIAGRIIKYRDILGGFHSKDQLTEVYGITEELFISISGQVQETGGDQIQKINLNKTTMEDLQTHPYIDPKTARKLIRVRKKYGDYTTLRSLKDFDIADEKTIAKISPYLTY